MLIISLITIAVLLLTLGGGAKAVMDIIAHKFSLSIFSDRSKYKKEFWNPKESWKNKWAWDETKMEFDEKFTGSSTIFVFVTDAWHAAQALALNPLAIGLYLLGIAAALINSIFFYIVSPIIALALYKVVFEVFYSKVLTKKNRRK